MILTCGTLDTEEVKVQVRASQCALALASIPIQNTCSLDTEHREEVKVQVSVGLAGYPTTGERLEEVWFQGNA